MDTPACPQCGEGILPQWIVCPVCSHPTETSETISARISCTQCRESISPEDLICSHCHVPIIRRYCSGCKSLIPDHVLFCPYCGATPAKKRSVGTLLKAGVGLAAGSLVLGFLLYYRPHSASPSNSSSLSATDQKKEAKQYEAFQKRQDLDYSSENVTLLTAEPTVVPPPTIPFNAVNLNPPTTNTVVENPNESLPPVDLAERGTRLMQGRKLSQIGAKYIKSGQYKQAVIVLRKAIEAFPPQTRDITYGESLYHLGYSLRMAGMPEEAIPVLKLALQFPLYNSKVTKELKTASAQVKKSR